MTSLTIRNLNPTVKDRLRVRAAERGHSMEAEVREILEAAVSDERARTGREFYRRARARFEMVGGVDLKIAPRDEFPSPPKQD